MLRFAENQTVSLNLQELTILAHRQSSHHRILLLSHSRLGKVLVIDDEIQHIEVFAPLYHEVLVHLPAAFMTNVLSVLILGGGSLYAAHEALKYPDAKVTLVDHDHNVLGLMQEFYPHGSEVINDGRFVFIEADASEYVQHCANHYDLIINDCFDLTLLPVRNAYIMLSRLLTPTGVCSDVVYRSVFEAVTMRHVFAQLSEESIHGVFSPVVVPEYPGMLHILTMWGNGEHLSQNLSASRNHAHAMWMHGSSPCTVFSPHHLSFYLYLPPYIDAFIKAARQ